MRFEYAAWLGLGALFSAGAVNACAVNGFEVIDAVDESSSAPTSGSGGARDAPDTGAKSPDGCVSAKWPAPPSGAEPGTDEDPFVVAVRSIDFGEDSVTNGPTIGYDLDDRCSCIQDGQSCKLPSSAAAEPCDGPGGIDNQLALLFIAASQFAPSLSSEQQSLRAESGDGGLLLTIEGYNGELDDEELRVGLITSPGVDKDPCYDADATPKWDGTDRWAISATAVEEPAGTSATMCDSTRLTPKYVDPGAYVRDGVLVANLPSAEIVLSSKANAPTMILSAGFLTAVLTKIDGSWHLREGTLAARWRMSDIFAFIGTIDVDDEPLCTNHLFYGLFKNAVCSSPDITAALAGPTTPCDAVSMGLGFTADPARLGVVYQSTDDLPSCDEAFDPALDSCAVD